jgi:hypothetical protein
MAARYDQLVKRSEATLFRPTRELSLHYGS